MKVRAWAIFVLAILVSSSIASGQAWREEISKSLDKKKSYSFQNTALVDIFRTVSQDADVNVILDSGAGVDPTMKLTFAVKEASLSSVLSWATRLAGLEWCVEDEAVFITKFERLSETARRQIDERNASRRSLAAKTWFPLMQEKLARKWSVVFEEKQLSDCAESLRILMGINFIISPRVNVKAPVELDVNRMSGESVIGWVARKAGVDYAVVDEAVYFAGPDEIRPLRFAGLDLSSQGEAFGVVTFDFRDTPFEEAVKALSEKSGAKIILRGVPAEMPKVTFSGKDMPLVAALQGMVSHSGLSAAIVPEGDTLIVTVIRPIPHVAPAPAQSTESTLPGASAPKESAAEKSAEPSSPTDAGAAKTGN